MIQYKKRNAAWDHDRIVLGMPASEWVSLGFASSILRFLGRSFDENQLFARVAESDRKQVGALRSVRLLSVMQIGTEMADAEAAEEAGRKMGKTAKGIQWMVNRGELETTRTIDGRVKIIAKPPTAKPPARRAFSEEEIWRQEARRYFELKAQQTGPLFDQGNSAARGEA